MALTTDEKKLLQLAICDGQFSNVTVGQNGMAMRNAVTPDVLNYVAGMSDEDVRVQLRQYQANKVAQVMANFTKEQNKLSTLQTMLGTLQAIQVTPPDSGA